MRVRFWGTRGSIATPGPGTIHFGGNTSCVEVTTDAGACFILDCGTGARALGGALMAASPRAPVGDDPAESHALGPHPGLPLLRPLFVPGNRITVCGPEGCARSLREVLSGQMEFTYFPVDIGQLPATIAFQELGEGTHEMGGARILAQYLHHPAMTLGYRIEADGASVVYLCDHEPFAEALSHESVVAAGDDAGIAHEGDRRHARFMAGAGLVIHDAQYTPEEYPAKKNWGHSTYEYAVDLAGARKGARNSCSPTMIRHTTIISSKTSKGVHAGMRSSAVTTCEVFFAFEGLEVTVARARRRAPGRRAARTAGGPAGAALVFVSSWWTTTPTYAPSPGWHSRRTAIS